MGVVEGFRQGVRRIKAVLGGQRLGEDGIVEIGDLQPDFLRLVERGLDLGVLPDHRLFQQVDAAEDVGG